jgi:hypothetical protein
MEGLWDIDCGVIAVMAKTIYRRLPPSRDTSNGMIHIGRIDHCGSWVATSLPADRRYESGLSYPGVRFVYFLTREIILRQRIHYQSPRTNNEVWLYAPLEF